MEFLSSQLKQIRERLSGATTSQWTSIALLTVLLVAGIVGMLTWSGASEWTALYDQPLTAEEMQRVKTALEVAGVPSRIEGDRIRVHGDDATRQQLKALLAEQGAQPKDTSLSYEALVKDQSPFTGDRAAKWRETRGLETELSRVLANFRGIKDARVLITAPPARGFGRPSTSSASVALTLRSSDPLDKQRVAAIANTVAGAVSGLKAADVKITDGQRFYRVPEASDAMPTEILDLQRQNEEHHTQKIYDQLQYIKGVVVNVHAALRTTREEKNDKKLGDVKISEETSKTDETTGPTPAAAPGVRPNQGRVLADAGTGSSSNKEDSITKFNGERDTTITRTEETLGTVLKLNASVNIPYSYLERVYRAQKAAADNNPVKPADIKPVADIELARVKALVKPLISAETDEQVVVDWYYDADGESPMMVQAATSGLMAFFKDYGPQAGLGLLAVISLLAVIRLAWKAPAIMGLPTPQTAAASVGATGGKGGGGGRGPARSQRGGREAEPELESFDIPLAVGEAQEMGGVLEGREVDAGVVRTQQIVKQIGELVKEDPKMAAGLVERWIKKE